jgi:hypothetical protein
MFKTYHEALTAALKQAGCDVDPDLLRQRALESGDYIPGVQSTTVIRGGQSQGEPTYHVNDKHLFELKRVVDKLISEAPKTRKAKATAMGG